MLKEKTTLGNKVKHPPLKKNIPAGSQWLKPVILATQGTQMRSLRLYSQKYPK
jgi:hypothetical protein